jgi:hypothetical protein
MQGPEFNSSTEKKYWTLRTKIDPKAHLVMEEKAKDIIKLGDFSEDIIAC